VWGDKQCPQTQAPLHAQLAPRTRQAPVLEQVFPSPIVSVLFTSRQHCEEIFSYSEEPCLIICVAFLMNYKELMLLAKHVTDAMPQVDFFLLFLF